MGNDMKNGTVQSGSSATTAAAVPTRRELSISQLRGDVKGNVIGPEDTAYDATRTVFYGGIDRRPAVIVQVADAADAAYVVSLARETGMELAIRSGGHSMAGHSVSDGGIVLDLSCMKALDIDVASHTVWAEAGLTAGEVTAAAGAHGLAIGFGDTGSVGIGGITLGGGVGFLVRKYGLTIDNLLAVELITADSQILQVDADSYPELFWAVRGGGGNFGVVTRFKFRLHDVESVVGGMLVLPASPDVIRAFAAEAHAAPEGLSTIANVMIAPPMPFLPAEYHGKLIIMAILVYAGDVNTGQQVIARFRALAQPIADMIRPMRYEEIYETDEEDYHPVAAARTLFIDDLEQNTAEMIVERLQSSTAQMSVAQIRVLGGAMARIPVDATAFAHRTRRIMVNVAALYSPSEDSTVHEAWVTEFAAAFPQGVRGAYVNFLGDEGEARVREAYPGATWERLAAIKARYDKNNLFRLNHNIPPAT